VLEFILFIWSRGNEVRGQSMQEEKEPHIVRAFGMPSFNISADTLASSMASGFLWIPQAAMGRSPTPHAHNATIPPPRPLSHLLKRKRNHLKFPGEALFCARSLLQLKYHTVYSSKS